MRIFRVLAVGWLMLGGCIGGTQTCPIEEGMEVPDYGTVYLGDGDPFEIGPLSVRSIDLVQCEQGAPKPLRIIAPVQAGTYAVVQFQHGFLAKNSWYSSILEQLASHGFIVVAPQMYEPGVNAAFGNPTAEQEADDANQIRLWIRLHLSEAAGVEADVSRIGFAGHSRGGKVAWLMLKNDPTRGMAVAGVDPVDGSGGPLGGQARVLTGPLNFPFPSLIIGTGRGGACAPAGDNHVQFYEDSAPPAWHIVATEYGHGDMLDDDAAGAAALVCDSNSNREPMRRFTAGLLTAFFRGTLQGDGAAFAVLDDAAAAPVAVTVESK